MFPPLSQRNADEYTESQHGQTRHPLLKYCVFSTSFSIEHCKKKSLADHGCMKNIAMEQ